MEGQKATKDENKAKKSIQPRENKRWLNKVHKNLPLVRLTKTFHHFPTMLCKYNGRYRMLANLKVNGKNWKKLQQHSKTKKHENKWNLDIYCQFWGIHSARWSDVDSFAMECHLYTIECVVLGCQWLDMVTSPHLKLAMFDWPDQFVWLAVEYRRLMLLVKMLESLPIQQHSVPNRQNSQHLLFERHVFAMYLDY